MLLKGTSNARLLRTVRRLAPQANVIVTALHFGEALRLYEAGAAFVYMPRIMGVRELQSAVESALAGNLSPDEQKAQAEMHSRDEVLP
jgi:DNA-binding NarL/FixJ family response regulator